MPSSALDDIALALILLVGVGTVVAAFFWRARFSPKREINVVVLVVGLCIAAIPILVWRSS